MKQVVLVLLFCVLFVPINAQIELSGGSVVPYQYTPNAATGIHTVYVVPNVQGITLSCTSAETVTITWSSYEKSLSDAKEEKKEIGVLSSVLDNIQSGRGYIANVGGKQYCVYIVEYRPITFQNITFDDTNEDRCSTLKLLVKMEAPDLEYYTVGGNRLLLEREYTMSYDQLVWDVEDLLYKKEEQTRNISGVISELYVDAPFCNTPFLIKGDQIASSFNQLQQIESDLYLAKAVVANPTTTIDERDTPNELEDQVDLGGSGPVTIHFKSNANEDVTTFYEWEFSDSEDFSSLSLRFTDKDMTHVFEDAGNTHVRLVVSNEFCTDSVNVFNVTVNESSLDVPNFFTPGTTPDVNDEFRVAYKSIVKFHAWIYDRNGVKLYEWSDPATGWDGKYNGKLVKPGAYFYIIEAVGADGKKYKLGGDVNILGTKE